MKASDLAPLPLMSMLGTGRDNLSVVAFGGGHGLAQALVAANRYARRLTAVVNVSDDGGSSGRLAPALEIPPPGDIRRCLMALTPVDSPWRELFEYRYDDSDVAGHSLGNLLLAALADLRGDFEKALIAAERMLRTTGSVIPACPQRLHLEATVDGETVVGQVAVALSRGTISSLSLNPSHARATPRALAAISEADQIVLGPGSLYTSILATIMVPGIVDAINRSKARLVYVMNLTTQDGETLGMDATDHLAALIELSGIRPPSDVIANSVPVNAPDPLEPMKVEPDLLRTYDVDVVMADLVGERGDAVHDPARLAGVLCRLVS